MKKYIIYLVLVVIVNISLFSEEADNFPDEINRKITIQTNPGYLLVDLISLGMGSFLIMDMEGQYKINDLFNASATLSFFTSFENSDFQIHIKPMFIYRPLKTGLKGFYIGLYPIIGFVCNEVYYWTNDKYNDEFYTEIGLGFNTGYKWIFNKGFTMQLGGGIGKSWSIPFYYKISYGFSSDGRIILDNFDVNFDFKIGYSF